MTVSLKVQIPKSVRKSSLPNSKSQLDRLTRTQYNSKRLGSMANEEWSPVYNSVKKSTNGAWINNAKMVSNVVQNTQQSNVVTLMLLRRRIVWSKCFGVLHGFVKLYWLIVIYIYIYIYTITGYKMQNVCNATPKNSVLK